MLVFLKEFQGANTSTQITSTKKVRDKKHFDKAEVDKVDIHEDGRTPGGSQRQSTKQQKIIIIPSFLVYSTVPLISPKTVVKRL